MMRFCANVWGWAGFGLGVGGWGLGEAWILIAFMYFFF